MSAAHEAERVSAAREAERVSAGLVAVVATRPAQKMRVAAWTAAWILLALGLAFGAGGAYAVSLATEMIILSLWAVSYNLVYGYLGEYSPGLYVAHRENAAQAFMIPDPSFDWDGWSMFGAAVLGSQGDVIAHHDGRLIRFDLASRSISWQIPTGFDQPSLAKGSIYVVRSGALNVLNERTGSPQWTWSPPHGQLTGTVIVTDSHVFTASADSVYAVDLATHQRAWGYAGSVSM